MISKKIVTIAKQHKDEMGRKLAQHDLYIGQDFYLFLLNTKGELSQKELMEQLEVEYSTISKMTNRLLNRGFIEKKTSQKDQRVSLITLTKKGKEVCFLLMDFWKEAELELCKKFTAEELKILSNLLDKAIK